MCFRTIASKPWRKNCAFNLLWIFVLDLLFINNYDIRLRNQRSQNIDFSIIFHWFQNYPWKEKYDVIIKASTCLISNILFWKMLLTRVSSRLTKQTGCRGAVYLLLLYFCRLLESRDPQMHLWTKTASCHSSGM